MLNCLVFLLSGGATADQTDVHGVQLCVLAGGLTDALLRRLRRCSCPCHCRIRAAGGGN